MPQWGLTKELRDAEPWDIPVEWLEPAKVVTDPVHGDIYLSKLEQAIVDSPPFQRLRRIKQLGMVHLVYPGATHTRFSHALGALRVVQDLLDIVLGQRHGRQPDHDLFAQWEAKYKKPRRPGPARTKFEDVTEFQWRVAEAIVLARLGSLLHDVCHVAFGHTIEDDLELLEPHDQNRDRFDAFWDELGAGNPAEHNTVQKILRKRELKQALQAVILAKSYPEPADKRLRDWGKYPFVADLVTNTICADLLDYLPRDHAFTGLPIGLGQRFMTAFYVVPAADGDEERYFEERMALRISHHGRDRHDISSELLKHLRFRYELQERAIVHHGKLAADSMLGKALELWQDGLLAAAAAKRGGAEIKHAISQDAPAHEVRRAVVEAWGEREADELSEEVKGQIEQRLRVLGDDGLLEYLAGTRLDPRADDPMDPRVRSLAGDLLDRRLYKRAAQTRGKTDRDRVFERFGGREKRRELEREAAAFAGVPEEQVVIWLPDPNMRLKIAEVLVDFGEGIVPFNHYSDRGRDIYQDHKDLWTVTVFVHRDVKKEKKTPMVLARLAELMGVEWDDYKPQQAQRPADWPVALAAEHALDADVFGEDLKQLLDDHEAQQVAHRSLGRTFDALREDVQLIADRIRRERRKKKSRGG